MRSTSTPSSSSGVRTSSLPRAPRPPPPSAPVEPRVERRSSGGQRAELVRRALQVVAAQLRRLDHGAARAVSR